MMKANLFKKLFVDARQNGLKDAIRSLLLHILGIDEQIKTLHFFLNELHSPAEFGPTNDRDLRILQNCDVLLLEIVDRFCKKHQILYWLDYGTLLGAVRHKGFIPWDDDMDIAMLRDDYQRFYKLAKEELTKLGVSVGEDNVGERIGVAYQHEKTGIWLDVFPVDKIACSLSLENAEPLLNNGIKKFRKKYKGDENLIVLDSLREKCIKKKVPDGNNNILYHGPEFVYVKNIMHCYDDVFPLSSLSFEGKSFAVPKNVDAYLKRIYGTHYMEFPIKGILHHGEPSGRPALSLWAMLHGVDMIGVYENLKKLYLTLLD